MVLQVPRFCHLNTLVSFAKVDNYKLCTLFENLFGRDSRDLDYLLSTIFPKLSITCRINYLFLYSCVEGKIIFQFNNMAYYNLQNVYLHGLVEGQPIKNRGNWGCNRKAVDGMGNAKTRIYQTLCKPLPNSWIQAQHHM